MPSWKKIITSGSAAILTNVTASSYTGSFTGSFSGTFTSASYATTSSFVNNLNQNVLITSSLTVGSSSLGPSENTITLGARDSANEGGQIGFNAPGGTYTSASFIDNYTNLVRILKGNNTTSTGLVAQWNLHTLQMQLPAYISSTSFVGTAAANLAVDSSGNVITVSTTGGTVFPYTGNAVITGSLTVTQPIYVPINGGMYFQGGDDAALYDVNVVNTIGIYGVQDSTVGSIKLGSGGGIISGRSGSIGIGTLTPNSGSLHVNGGVFATSFTGSLFGTSSWAVSSSRAITSSYALSALSSSYSLSSSFAVSSSRAITSSYALSALSASYAPTNQLFINNQGANYTLVSSDADKLIEMNVGGANTLTVPDNASAPMVIGTQIMVVQYGTGQTTISPAIGVTLLSAGSLLNLANQYSAATLVKRAVDEWYVFGDLA
jgi:hypothetical protein